MRRIAIDAIVTVAVFLLAVVSAGAQQNPQLSENVFKNVQVLRGIPVDQFMDTMGMFASSLGNNTRFMIDCGHNATTGWKPGTYLLQQGIRNLEMLAITNYDEDHASGAATSSTTFTWAGYFGIDQSPARISVG